MPESLKCFGQWSFIGPGSEKKWCSTEENRPHGIWDHIADEMLLELAESGCPIFRVTTPLSRGQLRRKGHGKLSIHFTVDYPTVFTEQLQTCVKNMRPIKIDRGNLMY